MRYNLHQFNNILLSLTRVIDEGLEKGKIDSVAKMDLRLAFDKEFKNQAETLNKGCGSAAATSFEALKEEFSRRGHNCFICEGKSLKSLIENDGAFYFHLQKPGEEDVAVLQVDYLSYSVLDCSISLKADAKDIADLVEFFLSLHSALRCVLEKKMKAYQQKCSAAKEDFSSMSLKIKDFSQRTGIDAEIKLKGCKNCLYVKFDSCHCLSRIVSCEQIDSLLEKLPDFVRDETLARQAGFDIYHGSIEGIRGMRS